MVSRSVSAVSALLVVCAARLSGAQELVVNGSFEDPGTTGCVTSAQLAGWSVAGASCVPVGGTPGWAHTGSRYLVAANGATVSQEIPTTPGASYRVRFQYSPPPGYFGRRFGVAVSWGTTLADVVYPPNDGVTSPQWLSAEFEVVGGPGATTTLSIGEGPFLDGIGSLVDSVSVEQFNRVLNVAISVPSGTYPDYQSVTLSCPTPGVTIYYTLDGSDPTTSSLVALPNQPIAITQSGTTLSARAMRDGIEPSRITRETYTLKAPPVALQPELGRFPLTVSVLAPLPSNAVVRYTTDGTAPTTTSPVLAGNSLAINAETVVRVAAFKPGVVPSDGRTGRYAAQGLVVPVGDFLSIAQPNNFMETDIDGNGAPEYLYSMQDSYFDAPIYVWLDAVDAIEFANYYLEAPGVLVSAENFTSSYSVSLGDWYGGSTSYSSGINYAGLRKPAFVNGQPAGYYYGWLEVVFVEGGADPGPRLVRTVWNTVPNAPIYTGYPASPVCPPVARIVEQSVSRNPGESATIAVAAPGQGELQYQWFFAGQPLSDGTRHRGVTTPSLTISSLTSADEGAYTCRVTQPTCATSITTGPIQVNVSEYCLGGRGGVLDLRGDGQYVRLPSTFDLAGSGTVEAWVYPRSVRYWSRLVEFASGPATNNLVFALSQESTGRPSMQFAENGASTEYPVTTRDPLPLNQWTHIAFVYNDGFAVILINGDSGFGHGYVTRTTNTLRNNNFIGRSNYDVDQDADALIDDLRIWNVARTQEQIRAGMVNPLEASPVGLLANYTFDDELSSTNSTIIDSSGNARNATLQGGADVIGAREGCCDSVDFNNDGVFPDDQDLTDFIFVLGGGACGACNDVDFNNDGVFPDDADLAAYLRVLGGGSC